MKPILIAGAGPGGLAAALAIESRGLKVQVLERTPELHTAGAGLILAVNAMRLFHGVEVGKAIETAGCKLVSGAIKTLDYGPIQDFSLESLDERFGFSNIGIHRGALSQILANALKTPVRFDAAVTTFSENDDGVEVQLSDGTTLQGSALIGADGIHSAVRRGLFGEHPLRYAGYTCWRGISEIPCPIGEGHFVELWDHGPRFGIVPISTDRTYWFATANTEVDGKDGPNPLAESKARFGHFGEPVRAMLAATERVMRNDIIDLVPLPSWTLGRTTLLGDAAHAMTPNMGQGANQAIEDGFWLASALASHPIEEALQVYEKNRRKRATRFVEQSFTFGRLATLENRTLVWLRDRTLKMVPQSLLDRGAKELYGLAPPV